MKTYAIAQKCDKHDLNRLIDRISGNAQSILDWYKKTFHCDLVLLFERKYPNDDIPDNLMFFEPKKLTFKDIEWLRRHQKRYGMSFVDSIQYDMDNGNFGIFNGICVSTVKDIDGRDAVYVQHTFLIELRHVYDI